MRNRRKDGLFYIVLTVIGWGYFFLMGEGGVQLGNDSLGYINASYEREPFYPLVIMICGAVFGGYGLQAVVYLQGIVALCSCLLLAAVIGRYFELKRWELCGCYLLLLLPFGLDTMWSPPRINYSHLIYTECFSYSFFYLFLTAVICYLQREKNHLSYVCMLLLAALMMTNRNQMEICFVVIGILSIWWNLIRPRKRLWKKCFLEIAGVAAALALSVFLTLFYCYVQWGYFEKSSENTFTMMSNLLYASDAEDAERFEDAEVKEVFTELYAQVDENGWTYRYADKGWYANGEAVADCHDRIKYSVIRPFFQQYVERRGMEPMGFEGDRIKKEVSKEIQAVLFRAHIRDWLYNACCMMPKGFVLSVIPIIPEGAYPYAAAGAVLIWAGFFAAGCRLLFSKKYREKESGLIAFAILIVGFMGMNVAGICLVIFVQSRYLDYTQGVFWIVCFLMLRALYRGRKRHGKKE
ncbi:MAG: hypothetical protein NC254_01950 [bacterium]|nr:hypothetical protein [bacterium]